MEHTLFTVRGRVQGVGFRWWARARALELGLVGTVRNREDGAVEVVAAGPPISLRKFRSLLHEGPPGALVESVAETDTTATAASTFEILRE